MGMAELSFIDDGSAARIGIVKKVLNGDVVVARREMQNFGLLNMLVEASLAGIAKKLGIEVAERVRDVGFERIHELVPATDILKVTDAVYDEMLPLTPIFLRKYVPKAFPGAGPLYFERYPNVRFHIPYDRTADHRSTFQGFRGEGKVAAHGPHRDSWLNCPDNAINVWIAIGRVQHGNGLTIFKDDSHREFSHKPSGDIADWEGLRKPVTFALQSGDAVIFHSDLLHGSELNRTDETRFVISFRLTFGKPHFPNDHSHEYVHAGWDGNAMKPLAMLPAKFQSSYARSVFKRAKKRAVALVKRPLSRGKRHDRGMNQPVGEIRESIVSLPLAEVPVGSIRAVAKHVCIARISSDRCVAVGRHCPHRGADLSNGWIDNGELFCPWHNLNFSPASGASPCISLPPLKRFSCEIQKDFIVIDTKRRLN